MIDAYIIDDFNKVEIGQRKPLELPLSVPELPEKDNQNKKEIPKNNIIIIDYSDFQEDNVIYF